MKTRLGIYGGTFSPPHLGHVKAAREFIKAAELDRLLIMPTFLPPHKDGENIVDADSRLEMCRLAFSELPLTEVSDFEIGKKGKSYTYITLSELSSPEHELYFLLGTDMFLTLDRWREPQTIFNLATVVLIRRESESALDPEIEKKADEYKRRFGARLLFIRTDALVISSTEIRERIASGKSTDGLLAPSVREYADSGLLYRAPFSDGELDRLRECVRSRLGEQRYIHTLGVEKTAVEIAECCLPAARSAVAAAALLHDIAKELTDEDLAEILKDDPRMTNEDFASRSLHHAFAAPYIVKRDFPSFATEEILSAVFNHTAGRDGMSVFDEIIFVADYVEPNRKYSECKDAGKMLFSELDRDSRAKSLLALHKCALAEIGSTERSLSKKGLRLNSRTEGTKKFIEREITKIQQKQRQNI